MESSLVVIAKGRAVGSVYPLNFTLVNFCDVASEDEGMKKSFGNGEGGYGELEEEERPRACRNGRRIHRMNPSVTMLLHVYCWSGWRTSNVHGNDTAFSEGCLCPGEAEKPVMKVRREEEVKREILESVAIGATLHGSCLTWCGGG